MSITYREIVIFFRKGLDVSACFEEIQNLFAIDEEKSKEVKNKIANIQKVFKRHWKGVRRGWDRFEEQHGSWMERTIELPIVEPELRVVEPEKVKNSSRANKRRFRNDFNDVSQRTKQRRVDEVIQMHGNDQNLMLAVAKKCSSLNDDRPMSKILSIVIDETDKKSIVKRLENIPTPISPTESLAFLVESDLGRSKYNLNRTVLESHHSNVNYASTYKIGMEKKYCYPPIMNFTTSSAESPWSSSLPFAFDRLIEANLEKFVDLCEPLGDAIEVTGIFSCGMDSSGRQQKYQQEVQEPVNESSLFAVSFILLQLETTNGVLLYRNENCQSPRSVRTQKIFFGPENKESITREFKKMMKDIEELENHIFTLPSGKINFFLKFKLLIN
jgi:hypothetical protein